MPYKRTAPGAKPHAFDTHYAALVARASSWSVVFIKGPGQRIREEAACEAEARETAARLNAEHGRHGRRAVIYAITPDGSAHPIGGA